MAMKRDGEAIVPVWFETLKNPYQEKGRESLPN
jgi:hypothetical protein